MRYLVAILLGALILALVRGGCEARRADGWRDAYKAAVWASQANIAATAAKHAQERATYQEKARDADLSYSRQLADARDRTADFIAARRVQPNSSCRPAGGERQAGAASVRSDLPADPVMVGTADVQACGEWVAYGSALRDWALEVGE